MTSRPSPNLCTALPAGSSLHVLPGEVDDDQAVFVEPLAAAFQVLKQLGASPAAGSPAEGNG